MKPGIAANTAYNFIGSFLTYFAGIALLPMMVRYMGLAQFGLYSMISIFSVTGFIYLIEMGFQSSVIKYTAEYAAHNDNKRLGQLASSVTILFLCLGLIVGIAGFFSLGWLIQLLNVPLAEQPQLTFALKVTFATYVFGFPALIATGVLQGLHEFKAQKAIETLFVMIRVLGTILILMEGYGLSELVVFTSILQVAQCFSLFGYLRARKNVAIRLSDFSTQMLTEIREMTALVFVGRLSSFAFTQTDRIIISHFLGSATLGLYEAAIKLPFGVKSIMSQLNVVLMPASSHRSARGEKTGLGNLFSRGLSFQILFTAPIITALSFFSAPLIKLWLGEEALPSAEIMRWALMIPFLSPLLSVGSAILLGANKEMRRITSITFASALLNLVLDWLWVPIFGLKGVIWATCAGLAASLPAHWLIFQHEFKFGWQRILRMPALSLGLCGTAFVSGVYAPTSLELMFKSWLALALGGSALSALTFAVLFHLGLSNEDKDYLFFLVRRKVAKP